MSNTIEVKVPDIGDFSEVEVIEVLVSEGDTIAAEQSLITVESDKASMEIPSPQAGVVKSMSVKVGDKIKEGSVILQVATEDAGKAGEAPQAQAGGDADSGRPADEAQPKAASGQAATAAAGQSGGERVTIVVPDIGDATDVEVIEIMVAVGDTVAAEQSLITVESDKASMEVPASHAGVVTAVKVKLGDKVNEGSEIIEVQSSAADAPASKQPAAAAAEQAAPASKAESAAPAPKQQPASKGGL